MKKLMASLAVLSALAFAAPASADPPRHSEYERSSDRGDRDGYRGDHDDYRGSRHDNVNWNFDERLNRLEQQIQRGARHGDLNRYETRRFYSELRDIRFQKRDFQVSHGISQREGQILDRRIDRFRDSLRAELRDDSRYGWNDRRY
jgi:hypothetical protein